MTVLSRRTFLRGLIAAPFVVKAELLMPVRALALPTLMPGDLVSFERFAWRTYGVPYAVCEPIRRIEGDMVVFAQPWGKKEEWTLPRSAVSLFHGLPGNRVNNPSVRHRLIRNSRTLGLCYPEDLLGAGGLVS